MNASACLGVGLIPVSRNEAARRTGEGPVRHKWGTLAAGSDSRNRRRSDKSAEIAATIDPGVPDLEPPVLW
jgi:hypothetical protein